MPSPARSLTLALVAVSTSALQLQPLVLPSSSRNVARTAGVDMGRKGRPKMPGGAGMGMMPGGQMGQGPKGPPEDGSSLFYLYCRAERKDLWYPVSVLQSDSQAPTPPTAHRSPPTASPRALRPRYAGVSATVTAWRCK